MLYLYNHYVYYIKRYLTAQCTPTAKKVAIKILEYLKKLLGYVRDLAFKKSFCIVYYY